MEQRRVLVLKQFEDAKKNGVIVKVTLTKYAESVSFEFKDDHTLEVIYSNSKKENYLWKFKRDLIFEIHFLDKISQLFLQRKNDPHHGIMLKV